MSGHDKEITHGSGAVPFWRRFGATWETASPWLFAILGGSAVWYWNPPTKATASAIEWFLKGSIDAAAVLAGFQVTALSLLLAIADKPLVKRLKDGGFWNRIISYHWHAIVCMLAWLAISLIVLTMNGATALQDGRAADLGSVTRWSAILLTTITIAALCTSIRVTRLLVRLLRIAM